MAGREAFAGGGLVLEIKTLWVVDWGVQAEEQACQP